MLDSDFFDTCGQGMGGDHRAISPANMPGLPVFWQTIARLP
jgi:hypothetical protein